MSASKSKSADAKPKRSSQRAAAKPAAKSTAEPAPAAPAEQPQAGPAAAPAPKPARGRGKQPVELGDALVHAFETNERINQYLLEQLAPEIWDLEAPVGKGRVIRGVFAHIHNVRRLWLARRADEANAPAKLERDSATIEDTRAALAASCAAVTTLLREVLAGGGHMADFKPDVAGFVGYAIAHEAHHRGQICILARLLGKPLPQAQGYELWNWRKRAEEARPSAP
jgi:uncharacterized damage-inducible protein DinB